MAKAWSFSGIKAYQTCPRQYQEVKLLKHYQETPHPTTVWGTRGHLALEERVRDGKTLPAEFSYLEKFAKSIIAIPGDTFCEHELACTVEKLPTDFHADDAWTRGIIDVFKFHDTEAIALDYKFGKVRPTSQLKLMALLIFANYPTVKRVNTRFLWIANRDKTSGEFLREDTEKLWKEFEMDAAQFLLAHERDTFPPKASGLCKPNPRTGYAGCVVNTCEFYGKGNRGY